MRASNKVDSRVKHSCLKLKGACFQDFQAWSTTFRTSKHEALSIGGYSWMSCPFVGLMDAMAMGLPLKLTATLKPGEQNGAKNVWFELGVSLRDAGDLDDVFSLA